MDSLRNGRPQPPLIPPDEWEQVTPDEVSRLAAGVQEAGFTIDGAIAALHDRRRLFTWDDHDAHRAAAEQLRRRARAWAAESEREGLLAAQRMQARSLATTALMRAKWHDSMADRIAALLRPRKDGGE